MSIPFVPLAALALLCFGGCISSTMTPVDATLVATAEFGYSGSPSFAGAGEEGYIVAAPYGRRAMDFTGYDLGLRPRWIYRLDGVGDEEQRLLWLDASADDMTAVVASSDADRQTERIHLRRQLVRDGVLVDSIVLVERSAPTAARHAAGYRVMRDIAGRSTTLYRLHFGWSATRGEFDTAGIEMVTVKDRLDRAERAWARLELPSGMRSVAEVERWGVLGLEPDGRGGLVAISLAAPSRVVVHRIDISSGRDDTVGFAPPGLDPRSPDVASIDVDIASGDDGLLSVIVAGEMTSEGGSNAPPRIVLARVDMRSHTVERLTRAVVETDEDLQTEVLIAAHAGEEAIVLMSQLDMRSSLLRHPIWLDGILAAFDAEHAPALADRFPHYRGWDGVTTLFHGGAFAGVLYSEGPLDLFREEHLTLRVYNVVRGRLESAQRLLKTEMSVMSGSVVLLPSGEIIATLTDGSSAHIVRLQPTGAHRVAAPADLERIDIRDER